MPPWQGRVWAPLACALGLGQALGCWAPLWRPGLWTLAGCLVVLLVGARQRVVVQRIALGVWVVTVAALRAQATLAATPTPQLDLPMPRIVPPIQRVWVDRPAAWSPGGHRFEGRWLATCGVGPEAHHCTPRTGRLRVQVAGADVRVALGEVWRVPAFTAPPPGWHNPGARDAQSAWQRQGLVAQLEVRHGERMAREPADARWLQRVADQWLDTIARWRRTAVKRLLEACPGRTGMVLAALALGDQSVPDPAWSDGLQATGTAHLVAVSGSHLALVVVIVHWTLGRLLDRCAPKLWRRAPRPRWLAGPCIAVAWGYALLTGAASSTLRAAWMATVALLAAAGQRRVDPLEALGLAAVALALADPLAVADLGLVLSVAGVLGLGWAAAQPPATGTFVRRWTTQALRTSLAPFALTAPIVASACHVLAWAAPVVNLVLAPWFALLLPAALMLTLLAVLLPKWPAWLIDVAGALVAPADLLLTGVPSGLWPVSWLDGPRAACLGLALPVTLAWWWHGGRGWRRATLVAWLATASVFAIHAWRGRLPEGHLRGYMLDVGHGDSIALEFADGSHLLLDGGGFVGDDGLVGRMAVLPFLRLRGWREVERMVLSHAHPDHENGLLAVARALPVGELWWNGQPAAGAEHRALMALLDRQEVPLRAWGVDVPRQSVVGGVTVRVLQPEATALPFDPSAGMNDNSLVVQVETGRSCWLLAGDIEREGEARLAASGQLRSCDVLKVPHHGSRTSSTMALLDAVQPRLALAGARPWGPLPFPHAEVAQRYAERATPLWRTAEGLIELELGPGLIRAQQGERTWQSRP
jgi:competence protein ComEC